MRTRPIALTIALIFSAPLPSAEPGSRDWTRTDTLLAAVYVASELADWSQTSQIKDHPGLHEDNPALGMHPDQGQINRHFIRCTISDLAIAYILRKVAPAWVSRSFLLACTIQEIECIRTNYRNGIKVKVGIKF